MGRGGQETWVSGFLFFLREKGIKEEKKRREWRRRRERREVKRREQTLLRSLRAQFPGGL